MGEMYPPTAADYAWAAANDANRAARSNAQQFAALKAQIAEQETRLRVLETLFGINR